MTIVQLIDEDIVDYKVTSMLIGCPYCCFKCGAEYCQNIALNKGRHITIDDKSLIERYLQNELTHAIVFAGLEPFDSFDEVYNFIKKFRHCSQDDIVIYTGYTENEIKEQIGLLSKFQNIIVKFGRYKPNNKPHYDKILGVNLVSDNQYAKQIS